MYNVNVTVLFGGQGWACCQTRSLGHSELWSEYWQTQRQSPEHHQPLQERSFQLPPIVTMPDRSTLWTKSPRHYRPHSWTTSLNCHNKVSFVLQSPRLYPGKGHLSCWKFQQYHECLLRQADIFWWWPVPQQIPASCVSLEWEHWPGPYICVAP